MTLATMLTYGCDGTWDGNVIRIPQGTYSFTPTTVEADWSAASYWYAMAALAPGRKFKLMGLCSESLQGDSAVAAISKAFGVSTTYVDGGVSIVADKPSVTAFSYDFNSQPDLAQTFVVLCCLAGVHFHFTGLESLTIKETDRISALRSELLKLLGRPAFGRLHHQGRWRQDSRSMI